MIHSSNTLSVGKYIFSILRVHKVLLFLTIVIISVKEKVSIGSSVQRLEL